MDQVHVIRHQVLVEGRSQRRVAKEFWISRLTVRKYVGEAAPRRKETGPRARPVWAAVQARVETLLAESVRWTGGKQRLTATRLHGLLVAEGHHVGVTIVKTAVAEWRRQRREVFVPLTYRPGDLAEVDFFEVLVDVDGTRRKAWLFLMRLMYSGRDLVLVPLAVDQAAVRCSYGHENVGSSAVPGSLRWTITGMRTTATKKRRERPRAVKMSLQFSRVLTTPACIAGVLVSRPNFNALCGRPKL